MRKTVLWLFCSKKYTNLRNFYTYLFIYAMLRIGSIICGFRWGTRLELMSV